MWLFPHSLKKEKLHKTKMYNTIPERREDLYAQGEMFIRRCSHRNNNTEPERESLFLHQNNNRNIHQNTTYNTTDFDESNVIRTCSHYVKNDHRATKIQKEISLFYQHHLQQKKNLSTATNRRGRRNAVCEENVEERVGLRLCVQRYRHQVYMVQYEI